MLYNLTSNLEAIGIQTLTHLEKIHTATSTAPCVDRKKLQFTDAHGGEYTRRATPQPSYGATDDGHPPTLQNYPAIVGLHVMGLQTPPWGRTLAPLMVPNLDITNTMSWHCWLANEKRPT